MRVGKPELVEPVHPMPAMRGRTKCTQKIGIQQGRLVGHIETIDMKGDVSMRGAMLEPVNADGLV